MTQIIIIAAVAQNGVIGSQNDIPWRISEDFKRFKQLTLGYPCIMGHATYESLPSRPLPNRENIVLTRNRDYAPTGVTIFYDFNNAIDYVRAKGVEKAYIAGGATLYGLGLETADTLELTRVHRDFQGNVYFPKYDPAEWVLVFEETHEALDKGSNSPIRFTYETYQRRK